MNNNQESQNKKIAIIGLGFVGLPLAMLLISKGMPVIGVDLDEAKIKSLKKGNSYISDIKGETVRSGIDAGFFHPVSDYRLIREADAVIICVPTPLNDDSGPDLAYVKKAAQSISEHLQKGQLVVLESSTYPGTTRELVKPILETSGLICGKDFYLAYSPERVDPGNQFPIEVVPKVVGGTTKSCLDQVHQLYSGIYQEVVPVTSPETAELTKLLENTYRFINISFINEFAMICDRIGVDVWEVIRAASTKPYGFAAFYPGPGIGGHCIPVDPLYLQFIIKKSGLSSDFIELSEVTNDKIVRYIAERSLQLAAKEKTTEANILIYGVTYKRNVADVRESKSLDIIEKLIGMGADVSYHDPHVPELDLHGKKLYSRPIDSKTLKEYDCVVVLTDHAELPKEMLLEHAKVVFDTRGVLRDSSGKAKVVQLGNGLS
ncbi:nucleotide sugar dehydrogenase [Bacillus swezeyi]|uniref:UDP-N-acetyl-D-glucosamine dehydrogenase n=1 Tax=Bacillus swezeyi TaxID=1925020 RepID=A0A1R1QLN8_9BACI|nr:nucleotide sugar dehydrogenase [Bacillus swezeyi]MEC1262770.1 nucleotide sugar dehydrogenase [Bacillus swezeyi]MED2928613.1 nucleotide sugar dehydrogenase [Bacillus swezeyi]MED2945239.1 nucleotide sugar dehydrogenase [Bacillus swezeyi]MED2962942.1 nucleotide sugar dehydrogenase [Bacillus swezeyi]MED3074568.1 nucleotide sugar dehydrogenase [Bacillus swezeyi]